MKPEYLYRYDHVATADWDEDSCMARNRRIRLYLSRYKIVKRTEKGTWIDMGGYTVSGKHFGPKDKFVLTQARKHYACETLEEALKSYQRRKVLQIGYLSTQQADAERGLDLAEDYDVEADRER